MKHARRELTRGLSYACRTVLVPVVRAQKKLTERPMCQIMGFVVVELRNYGMKQECSGMVSLCIVNIGYRDVEVSWLVSCSCKTTCKHRSLGVHR